MKIKYKTKRKIFGMLFILPWFIGFLLFFLDPIIRTIYYSFHEIKLNDMPPHTYTNVGFAQYRFIFQDVIQGRDIFARVLWENISEILVNVPLIVIFSLFAALLVNLNFKGRGLVRVVFFLPIILGLQVVLTMLQASGGATTGGGTGGAAMGQRGGYLQAELLIDLLMNSGLPMVVVQFITTSVSRIFQIIAQSGVQILIFLAGLQSINASLYEVAKIEGANSYETLWKITIPLVSQIAVFVTIYTIVDLFIVSSITNEIYNAGILLGKIGIGAAMSVVYMFVVLLIIGVITFLLGWLVKRYAQ